MKNQNAENTTDQRRIFYWQRVRKYCGRYKNFNWAASEFILNFVYTHNMFESYYLKFLSKFDLSDSAANILMILYFSEKDGYKQQELGGLLLVSRANVTKVIDGMEKRGLVVRSSSSEDRRARFIKLTRKGQSLARRIIPVQNEKSVEATAGLSSGEIKVFNQLLGKLCAGIIGKSKSISNRIE